MPPATALQLIIATMLVVMPGIAATAAAGLDEARKAADIQYDQSAFRLELVKNQIELTIANHATIANDAARQEQELLGMKVFRYIPLKNADIENDGTLIKVLEEELKQAAEKTRGSPEEFSLGSLRFASGWTGSSHPIPSTAPFDKIGAISDQQLADRRNVLLTIKFKNSMTRKARDRFHQRWTRDLQMGTPRLIEIEDASFGSMQAWHVNHHLWKGVARIYRFRDIAYPRLLAPDLSHYQPPADPPLSESQCRSAKRIETYRREITKLWPRLEPYLEDFRRLALNNLRLIFFLKHVRVGH